MPGTLFLCATPIGNLEDITLRVLRVLKEVDLIAAEDTRNSMKLLNHYGIHTKMTSYHAHNKYDKAGWLAGELLAGKNIALITDAGMPAISDPGRELVQAAHQAGIPVTILPGACAAVAALSISGLPSEKFTFIGFLPRDKKERRTLLEGISTDEGTLVFYEAPHRLQKTAAELLEAFGTRRASFCKELTKMHEHVYLTDLKAAAAFYAENVPRGEYVILVEGRSREEAQAQARAQWSNVSIEAHVKQYESMGLQKKEAMKAAAADRGISKREVYNSLQKENGPI